MDSNLCSQVVTNVNTAENEYLNKSSMITPKQVLAFPSQDNCYPWMFRNETSGACECSDIPNEAVLCDPTIPRTFILKCHCMTFNHERNETELGLCLYGCEDQRQVDTVYNKLPVNAFDLNYHTCAKSNRELTLCGTCKAGYSPLVYSYDMSCMNCTGMTYNWIKYIAVAYIPLTFFFLFLVIVRFNGTSPLVRGFISVCQATVSPLSMRFGLIRAQGRMLSDSTFKTFGTIYGIWNLDFFRTIIPPICLDVSPLQALALDYAIAFYPLLLVTVTYILISLHSHDVRIVVCLWKPLHKLFRSVRNWDLQGSTINAFATFFVLSYLKILNVTFDLLVYTKVYTMHLGEKHYQAKYTLYFDPTEEYFQGEHLYYGITAILVGIFFVILPIAFLVFYPMCWFQKCLNHFKIRRQSLDMFVNCFQGYYKDGTNGTRDCRCFSVAFFLIQIAVMTFFTVTKSILSFQLGAIIVVVFMFAVAAIQPYKEQFKAYSIVDVFMLLIVALEFMLLITGDEAGIKTVYFNAPSHILSGIVELVPFLYFIGLIIWWIFVKKKLGYRLPCICVQNFNKSRSHATDCFPDRIENPVLYQDHQAPLLDMSQKGTQQDSSKYGSASLA